MKLNYLLLILIIVIYTQCSCKKIFGEDDKLSILKENYTGSELKICGYYYLEYGEPKSKLIYIFYRNGIILYGGAPFSEDIEQREIDYQNGQYYENAKNDKTDWGVFKIEQNVIKFEKWYPVSAFENSSAYVREGEILNDTTFHILLSYRIVDGIKTEISEKDETYHFKKFSPKPDSTNSFVP